jgi:hypothetical protein
MNIRLDRTEMFKRRMTGASPGSSAAARVLLAY